MPSARGDPQKWSAPSNSASGNEELRGCTSEKCRSGRSVTSKLEKSALSLSPAPFCPKKPQHTCWLHSQTSLGCGAPIYPATVTPQNPDYMHDSHLQSAISGVFCGVVLAPYEAPARQHYTESGESLLRSKRGRDAKNAKPQVRRNLQAAPPCVPPSLVLLGRPYESTGMQLVV